MIRSDGQVLKNLLEHINNVAVLMPKNPSYDIVASALALRLSIEQSGRTVSIACPDTMTVEFHRLVGVENVTNTFGSKNLIISFPGQSEIIDKVTYNVEGDELRLVIAPKQNTIGLDPKKVRFITSGTQADLVIFVGVKDLTDLGQIYTDAKDYLSTVKQYFLQGSPISDNVTHILNSINLPINSDIASNLFAGIEKSTNNFQSEVSAEIFESAALLMRKGAVRHSEAKLADYPSGSVPQDSTWQEPKIYHGTSVS